MYKEENSTPQHHPAAHCHARQTGKSSRCCTEKLTITVLSGACHIPRVPPLRREATLSGAKESWGVARGDRKPWCPIPFCPSPREGRVLHAAACKSPPAAGRRQPPRPGRGTSPHAAACKSPPAAGRRQPPRPGRGASCTPQRAKLLAAEGGNYNPSEGRVSPPAAHRRIGGGLPSADGKNAACACFCPCPGGHIPVGDYSHFSQTSGQYPTVA